MEKVSVIMPLYNVAHFVDEAISSIICQSYPVFDLIIVDDRSTDGTYSKAEAWRKCDPRVKLYRNSKNLGIAYSLNRAIDASNTRLIARMDGDDIAVPTRLEAQIDAFRTEPSLAICGTLGWYINADNLTIGTIRFPLYHEQIKKALAYFNPMIHPSYMVNRDSVCYRYDELSVPIEDYVFLARAVRTGAIVRNLPDRLIKYRRVSSGQQHSSGSESRYVQEIFRRFYLSRELREQIRANQGIFIDNTKVPMVGSRLKRFEIGNRLIRITKYRNPILKTIGYCIAAVISPEIRSFVFSLTYSFFGAK